ARTDRTEQLAFRACVGLDRDRDVLELRLARFRAGEQLVRLRLVLGAALLELGDVLGRGGRGLALRHEIVAAVARLDGNLVAEVAEVLHFLEEDEFHGDSCSLAPGVRRSMCCPNGGGSAEPPSRDRGNRIRARSMRI